MCIRDSYLSAEILATSSATPDPSERIQIWAANNAAAVKKYSELVSELRASSSVDFAMLSLADNEVHKLLSSDRRMASNA